MLPQLLKSPVDGCLGFIEPRPELARLMASDLPTAFDLDFHRLPHLFSLTLTAVVSCWIAISPHRNANT